MPDRNYVPVNPVQPKSMIILAPPKPNIPNTTLIPTEDWDGWPDGEESLVLAYTHVNIFISMLVRESSVPLAC